MDEDDRTSDNRAVRRAETGPGSVQVAAASHSSVGGAPQPEVSSASRSSTFLDLAVGSPNAALARRHALEAAINAVEAAVKRRDNYQAQMATKRAIEPIHELDDSRDKPRSELSLAGWSPAEVGIWKAHVAARNIAHHQSVGLVALHGVGPPEHWLRWSVDEQAVADLERRGKESKKQADAYRNHLANKPVLPLLRAVLAKVQAVVPQT